MSSPTDPSSIKPTPFVDAFVKHTGTQAALVAGFAFAVLGTVTFDTATPSRRGVAFMLCGTLTISLELLAAYILSTLGFIVKMNSFEDMEDLFETEMEIAYIAHLCGLLTFLSALILFAWIKYERAAVLVTAIVIATLLGGVLITFFMVRKNNRRLSKL